MCLVSLRTVCEFGRRKINYSKSNFRFALSSVATHTHKMEMKEDKPTKSFLFGIKGGERGGRGLGEYGHRMERKWLGGEGDSGGRRKSQ